jgi:hypothetical protein
MTTGFRALVLACLPLGSLVAQSLQITSPVNGTVVNPGQLVTVNVSVSGDFQGVDVIGQSPVGSSQQSLNAPPYQFTVQVPSAISPGLYAVTAYGGTAPGQGVTSDPVSLDVERPDSPVSILVEPTILELLPGEVGYLGVTGLFQDGTTFDLAQSTLVTYTSDTPGVATVGATGRRHAHRAWLSKHYRHVWKPFGHRSPHRASAANPRTPSEGLIRFADGAIHCAAGRSIRSVHHMVCDSERRRKR